MNFGRGFPIPQENGIVQNRDSWTPVTPGKPIPRRSNTIPVDMQGNQVGRGDWQELVGVYSTLLQDAPDFSAAVQNSNPTGALGQIGGSRNANVGMVPNGGIRNGYVGMVQNGLVGMVQNGGIRDGNVGIGQNGGIQNCLMITGQHGGNQSLGMGQNERIRNRNVGMGQNEGNQNSNVGMGQNGGNYNCNVGASQGNPSYIRYASSSTGTVYNEPANWSDGLLAGLLEAQKKAESFADVNGAPQKSFIVQNRPIIPNSSSQVGSNWAGSESRMLRKQGQTFSSSQDVRKYDLQQLPIDGFPVPYRPYYDLNSPPRSEVDATSSIANFFQFAPVTPDKGKLLENQVPQGVNYSVNGSSSQERDGQEQLVESMRSEVNENYFNVPITPGKGKLLEHHQDPQGMNYSVFGSSSQERDGQDQLVVSMRSENTENHCNAPVTPDKGKLLENHQVPQGVNYSEYGSSSQERDGQEQLVVSMRSEDNENHCNELLQNIVNLSSSAVSTALREHNVFDEGDEQGIDLNKTPQQKTPKRRKHRPKVIREGKPKRTPKPKAPENGISNETPSGKRKYVRKNGLKITEAQQPNDVGQVSTEGPQDVRKRKYVRKKSLNIPETQQENVVDDVTVPAGDPATKSCRRALSFDLESVQGDENQDNTSCNQIERNQESHGGFNLNFNPQDTEPCTGINSISQASAVHREQQNGYIAGTSNLQTSTYQTLLGNSLSPEASAPTTPLANIKAHALNAIARSMTMRNSITGHKVQLNGYTQVDRHASREGLGQIFYKADAACTNLDRAREPMLQSTSQLFMKDKPNVEDKRGLKRQSFEQIHPHALNAMNSPFMYQKMLRAAIESSNDSDHFDSSCLETTKKKKTQDGFYPNISTSLSGITAVKDSPRQEERGMNGVHAKRSNPQLLSSYFGTDNIPDNVTNTVNVTTGNSIFHPKAAKQNLQKHHVGSELQPYSERMAIKRSQGSSQVHDFNSLTAMVTWNQLPTTPPKDGDRPDYVQELRTRRANGLGQQQTLKPSPYGRQLNGTDQIDQGQHNNAFEVHQHLPTTPTKGPRSDYLQEIRTCQANVLEQKQVPKPSSTNQRGTDKVLQLQHNNAVEGHQPPKPSSTNQRGTDKMLQLQHNNAVEGHQPFSTKARGTPRKQKFLVSVDEITYRLEGLNISGDNKEQHALVIFKGDNSIIPFEPKKRKPRPKVDLDPETDRLWKLLMGKEGSEGAEAMNKDKEKWWEEEREVFRGRADSFIARMHLVQGDRRFSRWKGSVVDSVIGVFLTQNVSDHLSSSAFMSLAAKFPPESTIINEACSQKGTQVLVEEPNIQILEHNGSIKHHEKIGRHPLYKHSSIVACESTEDKRHFTSGLSDAANEHNKIAEEELISQDSFDSSVFQTADEQRSSSGSNSEAEDQTTGWKPSKNPGSTFMNLLHPEKGNMFEGFYSHVNRSTLLEERTTHMRHQSENQECYRQNPRFFGGINLESSSRFTSSINSSIHHMQETLGSSSHFQLKTNPDSQKLRVQYGGMSAEESLSSFPSTASGVTEVYHTNNQTYQQNNMRIPRAPTFVKYGFLSKHHTHQRSFQPGHQIGNSQNSLNYQQQISETHQLERVFVKEPVGLAETLAKKETDTRKQGSDNTKFRGANVNTEDRMSVVDKQNCFENAAAEANSKERTYSSHEPLGAAATNNVKTKKGKAEDEKRAFDWDSLRKQVLLNGEKRERSKDAVDSLNYEALRSADVSKISDAIRERGMNNMLAERIKDFLNRLVRDHERIDLEWLRDVPPDKAKDYLLSIRGLGLKSVECVRLLTLHHLAFPVDTNVGRIAVRLGWVPLQPLPESLQLHLLELYPVLESIQKYLWPRLCKLDQPTLYELHYQMITFGKVFCTKSKPNCNACPMRAECRHFASAFASARLALPGPEEKSIVSSAIPIVDNRKPKEAIRPLSLPPAENNLHKDAGFFEQICEPIIEEPSTPQSETTEISERDIEDAFYEDPDEIPTIKLNMEEFTTNLQNLMQDNMELQGDMSKALVALNPEAASIPTPKLKNVSRLRTEHQVYELPDSHPLLDGLDKREPDDPSPYLLAIWTPGETANSVQPPDSTCWAQESGNLCDDKTCFSCNSTREANSQTVRGTLLVPCRTAMRGSFPLNGTYFQVNEMFADHESSLKPIDVPRAWLWNLPRRTVFFGTSVSTIFKGLRTDEIQFCFWRGFVCVRGFDQKSRAPRPLIARLHFPASKLVKKKDEGK